MNLKHDIEGYKFIAGGHKRVQLSDGVALINATFKIGQKTFYGVMWINEDNKGDVERIAFFIDNQVIYNKHPRLLRILGVTRKDYRSKVYKLDGIYDTSNYHLIFGKNQSIRIFDYENRYKTYKRHGLRHGESWTGNYNKHNPKHIKEVINRYHAGLIDFNRCTNKEYEILVEQGVCEAV